VKEGDYDNLERKQGGEAAKDHNKCNGLKKKNKRKFSWYSSMWGGHGRVGGGKGGKIGGKVIEIESEGEVESPSGCIRRKSSPEKIRQFS